MAHDSRALSLRFTQPIGPSFHKADDPYEQSGVRVRPEYQVLSALPHAVELREAPEHAEDDAETIPLPPLQRAPVSGKRRLRTGHLRALSRGTSPRSALGYLASALLVIALAAAIVGLPPALHEGPPQYQSEELAIDLSWTEARASVALAAALDPAFGLGALEMGERLQEPPAILAWADLPEAPFAVAP